MFKTAANLCFGEKATISSIDINHPSSRRILEIGFTPGQQIQLVNTTSFSDPLAFAIRGSLIAIRRNEAESIIIL